MAREHRTWGYDRIAGALAHPGYTISDQTVGNILKRHSIPPAPECKTTTTWQECIRAHMDVLVATDFFTAEVWTTAGLVTYDVLFFIHLASRKVYVAGMTDSLPIRAEWHARQTDCCHANSDGYWLTYCAFGDIRGGRPRVAGTGITVRRIVEWYKLGLMPEEIITTLPHLSLAQVYAALTYSHANGDEIAADIAAEDAQVMHLETQHAGRETRRDDPPVL